MLFPKFAGMGLVQAGSWGNGGWGRIKELPWQDGFDGDDRQANHQCPTQPAFDLGDFLPSWGAIQDLKLDALELYPEQEFWLWRGGLGRKEFHNVSLNSVK